MAELDEPDFTPSSATDCLGDLGQLTYSHWASVFLSIKMGVNAPSEPFQL